MGSRVPRVVAAAAARCQWSDKCRARNAFFFPLIFSPHTGARAHAYGDMQHFYRKSTRHESANQIYTPMTNFHLNFFSFPNSVGVHPVPGPGLLTFVYDLLFLLGPLLDDKTLHAVISGTTTASVRTYNRLAIVCTNDVYFAVVRQNQNVHIILSENVHCRLPHPLGAYS